jgi:hypothetical protein
VAVRADTLALAILAGVRSTVVVFMTSLPFVGPSLVVHPRS